MAALTSNTPDATVLPLWNTVFCPDCEIITNSRGDECPACKGRSLVSLARILGGSLYAHQAQQFQARDRQPFDITITLELQQMCARDLSTVLERLTTVIAPQLARDLATLHVTVKPTVDKVHFQDSLCFPERAAA